MASRHVSRPLLLVAAVVLVLAGAVGGVSASAAPPSSGSSSHHHPPAHRPAAGSDYLALGDSVTFGYREPANLPAPDYSKATNFTGYPTYVAGATGLRETNLSCPGETSASFVEPGVTSNGCENSPEGPVGYRTQYPLHTSYTGTQLTAAIRFLRTHPHTRLVSLMIGANDGFLCQETTADTCASELPGVLSSITKNVRTILSGVRGQGHYRGRIVILNYYSLDYRSAVQNGTTQALNQALDAGAKPYGVTLADGYGVFQQAAAQAGGDTCTAGLITSLTTGGCGVHPSVGGQSLLAVAVEQALTR